MERDKIERFAISARTLLKQQISARLAMLEKTTEAQYLIENAGAMQELKDKLSKIKKDELIEEVAYTWFNRFCALRYMDMHGFNRPMVVSALDGNVLPEILFDAISGNVEEDLLKLAQKEKLNKLLSGDIKSLNPQAEIYRILLVAKCNALNKDLPNLFEKIEDYTELLLPDDLLSKDAIISMLAESLTKENCETVEVIGWLYQYYNSEKKDEVFASFKKGKKAGKNEIPAATQLFTPEWIVRYLVENSLGRLWMLNHPESQLVSKMQYYVKPADVETDFIKIYSPEEIKIMDPCCGSGHMLTYSFDILMEIYSEMGYTQRDAVCSIIKNNLYGIEIDERAGQLSYFALMMKAREKVRRFFSLGIQPNICVLEEIKFDQDELSSSLDMFEDPNPCIVEVLKDFENAKLFGSLIVPSPPKIKNLKELLKDQAEDDLFDTKSHLMKKIKKVLTQAEYLSSRYQIVVTNPPYMGKLDATVKNFLELNYPDSKTDLCTAFMERNWKLCVPYGYSAMVNMQSWMFLSSFEKLREKVVNDTTILSMVHIGTRGFDAIGGEVVSTTAFISTNKKINNYVGQYFRIVDGINEEEKQGALRKGIVDHNCGYYFEVSSNQFKKIPGSPIAYWASPTVFNIFEREAPIVSRLKAYQGLATGDNGRFLRLWYEISVDKACFNAISAENAFESGMKWFPCNKGGDFKKWYGNYDYLVNWENDGYEIKHFVNEQGKLRSRPQNVSSYFKENITFPKITSANFSARYRLTGSIHETAGQSCFATRDVLIKALGLLNSNVCGVLLKVLNPTLNFQLEDFNRIPYINYASDEIDFLVEENISLAQYDWDSFETSWDFKRSPLIHKYEDISDEEANELDAITFAVIGYLGTKKSEEVFKDHAFRVCPIEGAYYNYRDQANEDFYHLKMNEEDLNSIFIDIYGLHDELQPEEDETMVTIHRIYDTKAEIPAEMQKSRYALTKKEVVQQFVSYAVGCMFGRYSLDKDGLIYAGGAWDSDAYISYEPDEDNVIPVLAEEWFNDDIVNKFREFVKAVYGADSLNANMRFIEDALGKSIRDYFVKDFYADHIKTYQKRPIYWMFSSPKGHFNALVYLHRYDENTPNIVLRYLRAFKDKINNEIAALERENNSASARQLNNYRLIADDINDYEQILYSVAISNIALDLDDGVKVNYNKLGKALKEVKGLNKE